MQRFCALCVAALLMWGSVHAIDTALLGEIYEGNWRYSRVCLEEMKRGPMDKRVEAYLFEVYMAHLTGNSSEMNKAFRSIDSILLTEDLNYDD